VVVTLSYICLHRSLALTTTAVFTFHIYLLCLAKKYIDAITATQQKLNCTEPSGCTWFDCGL